MWDLSPVLKGFANYRLRQLAQKDYIKTQEKQLFNLIKYAAHTSFGMEHKFGGINSVREFQDNVPLRYYEDYWNKYWKDSYPLLVDCTWPGTIPLFALTSGTPTGRRKYIPCSSQMVQSNVKAALDTLVFHCNNKPSTRLFGGKNVVLGGSAALSNEAPGVYSGDLSGIVAATVPWWARKRYFPQGKAACIDNWKDRLRLLAEQTVDQDIRSISGVPSWMLVYFDQLFKLRPEANRKLQRLFPNLEMVIHGGLKFGPFYDLFVEMLEGSNAELREVYPASEGFIATADRGYDQGMRLIIDHQIFFEFVPVEELESVRPTRHWAANLERDIEYAVVLNCCSGLWGYLVGDTVKFIDLDPPRLLFVGRTKPYLSAFGEHLTAEEVQTAVEAAELAISSSVLYHALGPIFPNRANILGRHCYLVEFGDEYLSEEELAIFTRTLDENLKIRNEDYEMHRSDGFGMLEPTVYPVPQGTFAEYANSRGIAPDQLPKIFNEPELFLELISFVRQRNLANGNGPWEAARSILAG